MKNNKTPQMKIVLALSFFLFSFSLTYAQTGITINNPTSTITSSTGKLCFGTDSATTSGPIYGGQLFLGSSKQFQVNGSGNLIKINGVSYTWPSSQGTSGTVLTNDGSGNFTWGLGTQWQQSGSNIGFTSGMVGIGTTSPAYQLDVVGSMHASSAFTTPHTNIVNSSGNGIQIDGGNYTITSTNGTVGFSGNNLATSGAITAGNVTFNGNITLPTDTIGDTNIHFMSIDKHGALKPVRSSTLASLIQPHINPLFNGPCTSGGPTLSIGVWNIVNSTTSPSVLYTVPCEWVGVGTYTPDAPLSIYSQGSTMQFSVQSGSGYGSDVFSIDNVGNTVVGGKCNVNGGSMYVNSSSNSVITLTNQPATYYNLITKAGDNVISWTDNAGTYNSNSGLVITPWTNTTGGIRIDKSGNVGIGATTPDATLNIQSTSSGNQFAVTNGTTDQFTIDNAGNTKIIGHVVIGNTTYPPSTINTPGNYGLYVVGGILTEDVKVALHGDITNWSDYVFGESYKLKSLAEVSKYIKENKHLPGVPSADSVKANGIDVAQMDATLLKKIEELTLYLIQQQSKSEVQDQEINELKSELAELKKGKK